MLFNVILIPAWYHLKCTHFTLAEYVNKKSRIHTDDWFCSSCTSLPFFDLSNNDFLNHINDDLKLRDYFQKVTQICTYSKTCSVCTKKVNNSHIAKSFACIECKSYVHRRCTGLGPHEMLHSKPNQMKHWSCQTCNTRKFPFTVLHDTDVTKLGFNSNMDCPCTNLTENIPLDQCHTFKLVEDLTPDSFITTGPGNELNATYDLQTSCKFYSTHDFHKLTKDLKTKSKKPFSALHTNIESLMHNMESVERLCTDLDYPFDIIALTETWNARKN